MIDAGGGGGVIVLFSNDVDILYWSATQLLLLLDNRQTASLDSWDSTILS